MVIFSTLGPFGWGEIVVHEIWLAVPVHFCDVY